MDVPVRWGMFLGYKLGYGAKWNKTYLVADCEDFAGDGSTARVAIRETMDVRWEHRHHGVRFPLREAKDAFVTPMKVADELRLHETLHNGRWPRCRHAIGQRRRGGAQECRMG